jgi:hypothetical protein
MKQLRKRREQITKELVGHRVTQNVAEYSGRFWPLIGFGVGLIVTTIAAYLFINQRRKSRQAGEEDKHILLTLDEHGFQIEENSSPVLVGVISTKCYYPVTTPLDQLVAAEEQESNIIYFTSEDDAKELGFSAAPVAR